MNEKELLKSERGHQIFWICIIILAVGIVAFVAGIFILGAVLSDSSYILNDSGNYELITTTAPLSYRIKQLFPFTLIPTLLIAVLLYVATANCSITITDKRVYGKSVFFSRVDLPLDSISAVGTSALHGLSVSSSSGRIHFYDISNRDEMHAKISELLINRQGSGKPKNIKTIKALNLSEADELMKYKKLLDMGAITQEEYNAKKKELLKL